MDLKGRPSSSPDSANTVSGSPRAARISPPTLGPESGSLGARPSAASGAQFPPPSSVRNSPADVHAYSVEGEEGAMITEPSPPRTMPQLIPPSTDLRMPAEVAAQRTEDELGSGASLKMTEFPGPALAFSQVSPSSMDLPMPSWLQA